MTANSWTRRIISPSGLFLTFLCLFLPFLSISCESGFGSFEAGYSGMDFVVDGEPTFSGPVAGEITPADRAEMSAGVQPPAILAVLAILTAIGLGVGLPRPFQRWVAGAVASGVAWISLIGNQVMLHVGVERELRRQDDSWAADMATSAIRIEIGYGFWVTIVLLTAVILYNAAEIVVAATRPDPPPSGQRDAPPPPAPPEGPRQEERGFGAPRPPWQEPPTRPPGPHGSF